MSEIQNTEADFDTMEAEAPKPKKAVKKAPKTVASTTELARDRVKAKLAAANRPNKDDMLARLEHDN